MSTPSEIETRMKRSPQWRVSLGLLLIAVVPALVSAWLHPQPSRDHSGEVALAVAQGWPEVLWVDARSAVAYDRAHIPGAIKLSPGSWDDEVAAMVAAWSPGKHVVVYCDGHGCNASREVAHRLRTELGLQDVHVLTGGWDAWTGDGK